MQNDNKPIKKRRANIDGIIGFIVDTEIRRAINSGEELNMADERYSFRDKYSDENGLLVASKSDLVKMLTEYQALRDGGIELDDLEQGELTFMLVQIICYLNDYANNLVFSNDVNKRAVSALQQEVESLKGRLNRCIMDYNTMCGIIDYYNIGLEIMSNSLAENSNEFHLKIEQYKNKVLDMQEENNEIKEYLEKYSGKKAYDNLLRMYEENKKLKKEVESLKSQINTK